MLEELRSQKWTRKSLSNVFRDFDCDLQYAAMETGVIAQYDPVVEQVNDTPFSFVQLSIIDHLRVLSLGAVTFEMAKELGAHEDGPYDSYMRIYRVVAGLDLLEKVSPWDEQQRLLLLDGPGLHGPEDVDESLCDEYSSWMASSDHRGLLKARTTMAAAHHVHQALEPTNFPV